MMASEQLMDDVATYLGIPPEKVVAMELSPLAGSVVSGSLCVLGSGAELLPRWRCDSIRSGVATVPHPEVLVGTLHQEPVHREENQS